MDLAAKSGGPAEGLLRTTLLQIPTVFGRLVFLSSLRNESSGNYEHASLDRAVGREDADRILRQNHREVFAEWLCHSLEEQKNDLVEYMESSRPATGPGGIDIEELVRYLELIPASAHAVERQLYITDLETLLELLRAERRAAVWSREW